MVEKGSYTLIIKVSEAFVTEVGSLGEISFSEGFYAYNGSAFGPGGFKRIERHQEKSEGERGTHWHIDYLLEDSKVEIIDVKKFPGKDIECDLSQVGLDKVEGFGCSDCKCSSHLLYSSDPEELRESIEGAT